MKEQDNEKEGERERKTEKEKIQEKGKSRKEKKRKEKKRKEKKRKEKKKGTKEWRPILGLRASRRALGKSSTPLHDTLQDGPKGHRRRLESPS